MARDDFSKTTKEVLAKRVGYLFSNPNCRRYTIGPNEDVDKSTSIGISAHITAASKGGPRYDPTLKREERIHISNGIWLCSVCATLIDKDEARFPKELLQVWKDQTEGFLRRMLDRLTPIGSVPRPIIEVDLLWTGAQRSPRGNSPKNFEIFGDRIISIGTPIIKFWDITWKYNLVLINNSSKPAYNIKIIQNSNLTFQKLPSLPKVNNLSPLGNLDLQVSYTTRIEGYHYDADKLLDQRIPEELNRLSILIEYYDEHRNRRITIVYIEDQEIQTTFA